MDTHVESSAAVRAGYRRGTILGLTVAEVFILLLFLLMLAFLVLEQEWQVQQDRQARVVEQLEVVLPRVEDNPEGWTRALAEFEAPEEILTLRRQKEETERRAETLQQALEEAELRREEAGKEIERSRDVTRQAVEARDEALIRAEKVARELLVLREKGQNPPCWYEKIADGDGEREKPHYTFDFAVFDEHMVVRQLPPPPGRADDDSTTTYAEEAERLRLDEIPYGVPLTDTDVTRRFQPIRDAGKNASVRSYSCIFWVQVWDETSPDAKARWKQAHDGRLEWLFGTFSDIDTPWDGAQ